MLWINCSQSNLIINWWWNLSLELKSELFLLLVRDWFERRWMQYTSEQKSTTLIFQRDMGGWKWGSLSFLHPHWLSIDFDYLTNDTVESLFYMASYEFFWNFLQILSYGFFDRLNEWDCTKKYVFKTFQETHATTPGQSDHSSAMIGRKKALHSKRCNTGICPALWIYSRHVRGHAPILPGKMP